MNNYKETLTRFHNDSVIDIAENYASNALDFNPMILSMFAHNICKSFGVEY